METISPYRYKPLTELDSIRLLCLGPISTGTAFLEASLVHTTFSECDADIIDSYTALSYVWGDATNLKMIHVDSIPVAITSNLFDALCDIRDDIRAIKLWVDALCINQIDNQEKAIQVNMMSKIYANALHTIIYLGTGSPGETRAQDPIPLDTLLQMLSSRWFERVWVFQEFVLSKDPWVHWGTLRWRWGVVQRNMEAEKNPSDGELNAISVLNATNAPRMLKMNLAREAYRDQKHQEQTLLKLLQLRRGLGATDPRDMVFAQLSVAYGKHGMKPDYTKECFEIYNDFARTHIQKEGTYELLLDVGDAKSPNPMPGLASWAPDWRYFQSRQVTQLNHLFRLNLSFRKPRIPFGGEGKLYGAFTITQRPPVLACVGRGNKFITKIRQPLYDYINETSESSKTNFQYTLECIVQEKEPYTRPRALEGFKELYSEIIDTWRKTLGFEIPNLSEIWLSNHLSYLLNFLRKVHSSPDPIAVPHTRRMLVSDAIVISYLVPFRDIMRDRTLAQMSDGSIGFFPKDATFGDFIIYSSSQEEPSQEREPFLLREKPNTRTTAADELIKLQFGQRLKPLLRKTSIVEFPSIAHCEFIGLAYLDGLRLDETDYTGKGSLFDPLKDAGRRLLSASSTLTTALSEPKFGPVTIFAIH